MELKRRRHSLYASGSEGISCGRVGGTSRSKISVETHVLRGYIAGNNGNAGNNPFDRLYSFVGARPGMYFFKAKKVKP